MAHLWIWDESGTWSVLPLSETSLDVARVPPAAVHDLESAPKDNVGVILFPTVPTSDKGVIQDPVWSLLWPPGANVHINGLAVRTGFRVLQHKDEIRIGLRSLMFFSTERLARVEKLNRTDRKFVCPRDKRPIHQGDSVVICPNCRVVHHQTGEFNCWTYSPTCAMCDFPTDLDAGFQWIPDDLY